jgi:hypothetical protein
MNVFFFFIAANAVVVVIIVEFPLLLPLTFFYKESAV